MTWVIAGGVVLVASAWFRWEWNRYQNRARWASRQHETNDRLLQQRRDRRGW